MFSQRYQRVMSYSAVLCAIGAWGAAQSHLTSLERDAIRTRIHRTISETGYGSWALCEHATSGRIWFVGGRTAEVPSRIAPPEETCRLYELIAATGTARQLVSDANWATLNRRYNSGVWDMQASRDGSFLVLEPRKYEGDPATGFMMVEAALYTVDTVLGVLSPLVEDGMDNGDFSISPDSAWVAYYSHMPEARQQESFPTLTHSCRVVSLATREIVEAAPGERLPLLGFPPPQWLPDSSGFIYLHARGGTDNPAEPVRRRFLLHFDLATGENHVVIEAQFVLQVHVDKAGGMTVARVEDWEGGRLVEYNPVTRQTRTLAESDPATEGSSKFKITPGAIVWKIQNKADGSWSERVILWQP